MNYFKSSLLISSNIEEHSILPLRNGLLNLVLFSEKMTTLCEGHVIGIPIGSIADPHNKRSPKALLTDHQFLDDGSSTLKRSRVDSVLNRMNELGKKADSFAHGIKEHSPKITETVKGKLSVGAQILQVGRLDKIFKHLCSVTEGEKLLNASQCHLSTTARPIVGLLFISSEKIAFCSQKWIKLLSPNVELIRARYKVATPLSKIKRVNQSVNVEKPSQKFIEIVTVDNFDFWFMGFLNYKKAYNCLKQASQA